MVLNPPASYIWGCSSNLTPVSGKPGTFTASSTPGDAWVNIKVGSIVLCTSNFLIAAASNASISGAGAIVGIGSTTERYTPSPCTNGYYSWKLYKHGASDTIQFCASSNYVDITGSMPNNTLTLYRLELLNGSTILNYKDIYIQFSMVAMGPSSIILKSIVYPNPVSDNLAIEIESNNGAGRSLTCDIRLYDGNGNHLHRSVNSHRKTEFNVSNLSDGFYYLHIYNADNGELLETKTVIVKH